MFFFFFFKGMGERFSVLVGFVGELKVNEKLGVLTLWMWVLNIRSRVDVYGSEMMFSV